MALSDEIEALARQDKGCEGLLTVPGIGGCIRSRSTGWMRRLGSCKEDKRMRSDFGSMRFFSWHINTTSKLKVRQEVRAAFDSCREEERP